MDQITPEALEKLEILLVPGTVILTPPSQGEGSGAPWIPMQTKAVLVGINKGALKEDGLPT